LKEKQIERVKITLIETPMKKSKKSTTQSMPF